MNELDKLKKEIDYVLNKQIFQEYKDHLEAISTSKRTYFVHPEGYKKFKKKRLEDIHGDNQD